MLNSPVVDSLRRVLWIPFCACHTTGVWQFRSYATYVRRLVPYQAV